MVSVQRPRTIFVAIFSCIVGISSMAHAMEHSDGRHTPEATASGNGELPVAYIHEELSFEDALHKLRGESEDVRAAGAARRRTEAERGIALSRFMPEVSLLARATRMDAPIDLTLEPVSDLLGSLPIPLPPGLIENFRYEIQRTGFFNVTLDARMPLYTGGRLRAGLRAADLAIESATADERRALDQATTELVRRYYGARMAEEAYLVRESTARSLEQHARNARRLEETGQISRAERLRADVAFAEAQMELDTAKRTRQLTARALATLLSMEGSVRPGSDFFRVDAAPSLEDLQTEALSNNPQLQAANLGQARAHQALRAARGEFAPTVGAFAIVQMYRGDLTVLEPNWALGIQAEWKLFQGGQRFHRVHAAQALEQEIAFKVSRATQDIPLLVEKRHQAYEESLARLEQFERTRELAEESLRSQQRAFEAGLSTSLDVVDAELTLSRVNLGVLNSLYESNVAFAELMESIGRSDLLVDSMIRYAAHAPTEVNP